MYLLVISIIVGNNAIDLFSANLLLQDTIERIHVGKEYGDIPRGLFVVRGENVVLMGEVVGVCVCGGGGASTVVCSLNNGVDTFESYLRCGVWYQACSWLVLC